MLTVAFQKYYLEIYSSIIPFLEFTKNYEQKTQLKKIRSRKSVFLIAREIFRANIKIADGVDRGSFESRSLQ